MLPKSLPAFGQVYQTGADSYELFRGWALLIVFWVVASRALVHWMLLLLVTDLAIALYWNQVVAYRWESEYGAWCVLAFTQCLALGAFELVRDRGYFWLKQTWPRWILVPVILTQLGIPATIIVADDNFERSWAWLVMVSLVAVVIGGYRYYRHVAKDLFALTCMGFTTAWVVFVLIVKVLADLLDDCLMFLFFGLLAVGMLGLLVVWVRRLNTAFQAEAEAKMGAEDGHG